MGKLPSLSFKISKVYIQQLYNPRIYQQPDVVEQLYRFRDDFLAEYEDQLTDMLVFVEKYAGYRWEEYVDPFIAIYLVDFRRPSFSLPLTIKIRADKKLFLGVLIHELTHNLLDLDEIIGEDFSDFKFQEDAVNFVTVNVLHDLGISNDAYSRLWRLIYQQRFNCDFVIPAWKTVRDEIEKRYQLKPAQ